MPVFGGFKSTKFAPKIHMLGAVAGFTQNHVVDTVANR
jgi:hypothetical protein